MDDTTAARGLLLDYFSRLHEHADQVTTDLSPTVANRRLVPEANTIAWLVWHSARVIDAQLSPIAGVEQVWTAAGWCERFGLDLPDQETGYGQTPAEAAKVHADSALLSGYFSAVDAAARTYLAKVTVDELARVIDENWDPPVTVAARLVSIVDNCAQHLGAAAYVKGVLELSDLG